VCVLSDEIDMIYRFGQHMSTSNQNNSFCVYCYMKIHWISLVCFQ